MGTKQDEPLGAGQKKLVQDSYAMVAPIAETAAELFYNKLFEFDPSLKALFKTDIKDQGRKLMATLTLAVKGLDNLDDGPGVGSASRRLRRTARALRHGGPGAALDFGAGPEGRLHPRGEGGLDHCLHIAC